MPPRQNAITVQLTVESAIKKACATVSMLGRTVMGKEMEGELKRGVVLKGDFVWCWSSRKEEGEDIQKMIYMFSLIISVVAV